MKSGPINIYSTLCLYSNIELPEDIDPNDPEYQEDESDNEDLQ